MIRDFTFVVFELMSYEYIGMSLKSVEMVKLKKRYLYIKNGDLCLRFKYFQLTSDNFHHIVNVGRRHVAT